MPQTILLADDSPTAQNMARQILGAAGYEVTTVSSGAAALQAASENLPDAIVLDIHMPGENGMDVCHQFKASAETAHIPVLLTASKLEQFREQDVARAGADGVVVKPFEASELVGAVERALRDAPRKTVSAQEREEAASVIDVAEPEAEEDTPAAETDEERERRVVAGVLEDFREWIEEEVMNRLRGEKRFEPRGPEDP